MFTDLKRSSLPARLGDQLVLLSEEVFNSLPLKCALWCGRSQLLRVTAIRHNVQGLADIALYWRCAPPVDPTSESKVAVFVGAHMVGRGNSRARWTTFSADMQARTTSKLVPNGSAVGAGDFVDSK